MPAKKQKPAAKPVKPAPARKPVAAADPIVARTTRDLGSLVGRSHVAVAGWLKRDDWRFGAGPWKASDVVRVQQWMGTHLLERPATVNPAGAEDDGSSFERLSLKSKVDIKLKATREKAIAFALEVQKGKFHDVDECKQLKRRQFLALKQAIFGLPDSIPTDADTKTIIRGRIVEIFRRLAGGLGVQRDVNPLEAADSHGPAETQGGSA